MHEGKAAIRSRMQSLRHEIPLDTLTSLNQSITERLQQAVDWHSIQTLHTYLAIDKLREVTTEPLLAYLIRQYPNINIATAPQSPQSAQSTWLHRQINSRATLPPAELVPAHQQFDCIIVPVLAFDKDGYRLGWGGGWYDRFLARQPQALKIGIAYQQSLITHGLPREKHDIPLDAVVTDSRMYMFRTSLRNNTRTRPFLTESSVRT